ncbi:MAG: phenylalanine--tRNA ligase subunit alpha, partial [Bacteroidetes bacterium]|nr:phenylalanine--tRNA ligase subunit alpha [Bacteroidota bacterium]
MINRIAEILKQVNDVVFEKDNNAESFRLLYLSKKGIITQLFNEFKTTPNNQKKLVGVQLNVLKQRVE